MEGTYLRVPPILTWPGGHLPWPEGGTHLCRGTPSPRVWTDKQTETITFPIFRMRAVTRWSETGFNSFLNIEGRLGCWWILQEVWSSWHGLFWKHVKKVFPVWRNLQTSQPIFWKQSQWVSNQNTNTPCRNNFSNFCLKRKNWYILIGIFYEWMTSCLYSHFQSISFK